MRLFAFLILFFGYVTCLSAQDQPNIVMIISDDQAWNDYSFMGHDKIKTPHLDELAKQSVVFRRGYVPTALCRPSLMTMITGRYAHQHGVTGNDPSPKYAAQGTELNQKRRADLISFVDKFETIPKKLAAQGYVCHQSGKWWEGNFKRGGFTHGMTRGFPQKGGRHGDDGLKIGRDGMAAVTDFVDMAVEQKKPFFLWYAPFLPHSPHNPPQRLLDKYDNGDLPKTVAKYYAMCEWFDETCGQLISHLEEKDVRDNTLIIYVCDNGWIQSPDSRKYAATFEANPLRRRNPDSDHVFLAEELQACKRSELCSSIDLMPTILAAANIDSPKGLPGLNLMSNLKSGNPIDRDSIFGESFAHDIADINNPEASLLYRWCIQGKWKLLLTYDGEVNRYLSTHPRTEKRPQLYDLSADPQELKNVAGEHADVVAKLAKKIEGWYPLKERKALTRFN